MLSETITCIVCGNEFEFTEGERQWFERKFGGDFVIPKRCKGCRDLKKQERLKQKETVSNEYPRYTRRSRL